MFFVSNEALVHVEEPKSGKTILLLNASPRRSTKLFHTWARHSEADLLWDDRERTKISEFPQEQLIEDRAVNLSDSPLKALTHPVRISQQSLRH
jgi:hypothetical protein